jgi:hypothetical protein
VVKARVPDGIGQAPEKPKQIRRRGDDMVMWHAPPVF